MINKLAIFDFDGTLSNSPKPEEGIPTWEKHKKITFTHDDWWGRPESLDTNIFDIKLFTNIVNILKREQGNKNTEVIILSSRIEKLRPYIVNILKKNKLSVKYLELKKDDKTKGEKILDLLNKMPSVKIVDVYDDRNVEIKSYLDIKKDIPSDVKFNIFRADNGIVNKLEENENIMESQRIGTPMYLPQISAPYTEVLADLDKNNIGYEESEMNPNDLNPLQKLTFSDRVDNVDINKPIWVSNKNDVLDGHHRLIKAIFNNIPIKVIRIKLNTNDACRVLNKFQDIYEYSKQLKFEEDINDTINNYNDKDNELSDYITSLEEEGKDDGESNKVKIVAYRKEPIKENSVVGNFFVLEPMKEYNKYEIEFDNLLDTDILGLSYKDGQLPVDVLAKTWFPNINFEKIAANNGVDSIKVKNRAVAEKAKKLGYDGIKYGDKLLQGI